MTEEEIAKAVQGVMELRPTAPRSNHEPTKSLSVMKRMSDVQFQQELQAIMKDEPAIGSAFYFTNLDPNKARKNMKFNG
ncbi:hypothetical protein [Vibrio sp. C8]